MRTRDARPCGAQTHLRPPISRPDPRRRYHLPRRRVREYRPRRNGRGTAHIAKTVPLCRRVFVENRGMPVETWYLIDSYWIECYNLACMTGLIQFLFRKTRRAIRRSE